MIKNTAGQKVIVYAHDTAADAPKTGDAANITAYIAQDAASIGVSNDANPTELDATNMKGLYAFDLTQAETNGDTVTLSAVSATGDVSIEPVTVYTQEVMRGTDSASTHSAADVADAVWDEATADHVTTASMGAAVTDLTDEAFGKWVLDPTGKTLTHYRADGITVLKTFDLTTATVTVNTFVARTPQ